MENRITVNCYFFGPSESPLDFRLDEHGLWKGQQSLKIGATAERILRIFVEKPGVPLPKELIWKEGQPEQKSGSPKNFAKDHIKEIRKWLDHSAISHTRGSGYAFEWIVEKRIVSDDDLPWKKISETSVAHIAAVRAAARVNEFETLPA